MKDARGGRLAPSEGLLQAQHGCKLTAWRMGAQVQGEAAAPESAHCFDEVVTEDKHTLLSSHSTAPTIIDLNPGHRAAGQSSWVSGVFHLITFMIGSGVLTLPRSFAALGWALAPLLLTMFGAATVWSSYQLAEVFQTPDGRKHYTYKDAVASIMGGHHPKILASIQYLCLFLGAVGSTLAGMSSIVFIATTACTYSSKLEDVSDLAPSCPLAANHPALLLFSGVQLIINVLPNLESIWWVSAVGAAMSYLYSALAVLLSIKQLAISGPAADTSAFGRGADTPFLKAMDMFSTVGNLAFAWLSGLMLHSIQATLKEPPRAVVSMRKTIAASYSSTGLFYISIATLGYAALGAATPGDVLTGFSVSRGVELVANSAVLLHMAAAAQVYMHPIYEALEETLAQHAPALTRNIEESRAALVPARFTYRALFTAAVTVLAHCLPHFSLVSGLNGAISFWPLQIGYPFAMYIRTYPTTSCQRCLMYATSAFVLCACVLAGVGSLYALATVG